MLAPLYFPLKKRKRKVRFDLLERKREARQASPLIFRLLDWEGKKTLSVSPRKKRQVLVAAPWRKGKKKKETRRFYHSFSHNNSRGKRKEEGACRFYS